MLGVPAVHGGGQVVLAEAVVCPVADLAELGVGAGEVQPCADVPAAVQVQDRDGVGGSGEPAQHAAGLLPVGVTVERVPPRRP